MSERLSALHKLLSIEVVTELAGVVVGVEVEEADVEEVEAEAEAETAEVGEAVTDGFG